MENFVKLFNLIELTRSQPQYGYALAGIKKDDLSDLAQHHYLVSFIAWQIALHLRQAGAKIDIEKVLGFTLTHDLGELFGGDIGMPYARANLKARKLAKAFEAENTKYLSRFFGDTTKYFKALTKEIFNAKSNEAIIAKIADYVEVTHYKRYVGKLSKGDIGMAGQVIQKKIEKVKDPVVKEFLIRFAKIWLKDLAGDKGEEFFEQSKEL